MKSKKKFYIAIKEENKPLQYLCENATWTNDISLALGINKTNVAEIALHKINATLTEPPYCILVYS